MRITDTVHFAIEVETPLLCMCVMIYLHEIFPNIMIIGSSHGNISIVREFTDEEMSVKLARDNRFVTDSIEDSSVKKITDDITSEERK